MMYTNVSEEFEATIKDSTRSFRLRLEIDGISSALDDDFTSATLSFGSTGQESYGVGIFYAPSVQVVLYPPENVVFSDKDTQISIGLELSDESVEYVPMGEFIAPKPSNVVKTKDSYTITYMTTTEHTLESVYTPGVTFPTTVGNMISDIRSKTGVQFDITMLPSSASSVVINSIYGTSEDEETTGTGPYLDAIRAIAAATESNATVDRTGQVKFIKYGTFTSNYDIDPDLVKSASISETALVAFYPGTVSFLGDPCLDPWDIVSFYDEWETTQILPCCSIEHVYDGGLTTTISTPSEATEDTKGPIEQQLQRNAEAANTAKLSADAAASAAASAQADARSAHTAADQAQADADTANLAAQQALSDAATANTAAQQALRDAESAGVAAASAGQSASVAQSAAQSLVKEYKTIYYASSLNAMPTMPSLGTEVVSTADSHGNGAVESWTTVIPSWDANYPYYWEATQYLLTDLEGGSAIESLSTENGQIITTESGDELTIESGVGYVWSTGLANRNYAIEDARRSNTEIYTMEQYFWHDTDGAHVVATNSDRVDIDSDGMKITHSGMIIAEYTGDGLVIRSIEGTQIAHLGYGETVGQTSTGHGAYYDIGRRKQGTTIGNHSVVEGYNTEASGYLSHAEGFSTVASGPECHAEGSSTVSGGYSSHAEGDNTEAGGTCSHAEGSYTRARGARSHAEGSSTIAASNNQHVQGSFNVEDDTGKFIDIVGNGRGGVFGRSNASALDTDGNLYLAGDVYTNCEADSTGGTNISFEQYTSGDWTVRKWGDGTAECWGRISVNASKQSGIVSGINAYRTSGFSWPYGLFISISDVQFNGWCNTGSANCGVIPANSNYMAQTSSPYAWFWSEATTSSVTTYLRIRAIGRWK